MRRPVPGYVVMKSPAHNLYSSIRGTKSVTGQKMYWIVINNETVYYNTINNALYTICALYNKPNTIYIIIYSVFNGLDCTQSFKININ